MGKASDLRRFKGELSWGEGRERSKYSRIKVGKTRLDSMSEGGVGGG